MKPIEALFIAIQRAFFYSYDSKKPGIVIDRLPKDVRESIKELSSDDTQNVRIK